MPNTVQRVTAALADRYRIEREIGAGGMATVYLARDVRHARNVAVKVLSPELGAVLGVERFLAEITVTANLQHPNILPLFDSGEADGLLFYVMPFVEGESLRARLQREAQLPVDEAVRIGSAVAAALDYAHRHDVIHRDLKPENILLHEGQPLIADFGIALAVSNAGGNRITQTGLSLGTPQYMSPEQATGDRAVDGRSDIYSLGALVYEMLAGEAPHAGPTAQSIIVKLMTEEVRPLTTLRRTVPPHVDYAVRRALERLAADRFATAHEFAEALQGRASIVATAPTRTQDVAASPPLGPKKIIRIIGAPLATVAALALAAVATAGWWNASRRETVQPTVRFNLTLPAGLRLGTVVVGSGSSLAISPDGNTVAFIAAGGGTLQQLFVRTVGDVQSRVLPGTDGASAPFFSPDGKSIAFFSGQLLKKTSVAGGGVSTLTERLSGPFFGGAWSKQDKIVLGLGGRLMVLPAAGGAPSPLFPADTIAGRIARWPRILPDGETLLFASSTGPRLTSRIAVGSVQGRTETILDLPGIYPLGFLDGHLVYVAGTLGTGTLMTVPFDLGGRRLAGSPRPVVERLVIGNNGAAQADLSAAGTLIHQTGIAEYQGVLADPDGRQQLLIAERRAYGYARFSPDGRRVAFTVSSGASADVWIYDLASGTPSRLTTEGAQNDRPEWSPDGKRVLYRSSRSRSGYALWWQPSDGSGVAEPLLELEGQDVWEGVLTKDGKIIYRTGTFGTAQIWYRSLTGDTTSRAIATTDATEWAPRLSPDEKWIAYTSEASGTLQVYVRPFPGPGPLTQVSVDGGDTPVWSRDGRRLFYVHGQQLMAATLAIAPSLAVTAREKLLEGDFGFLPGHAAYDVAPDGKRLLLFKAVGNAETIIAYNWGAELRAGAAATPP